MDTGASRTVVEERFLEGLGLLPLAEEEVHTASTGSAPMTAHVYAVELTLGEEMTGTLAGNLPVLAAIDLGGLGVQMLLGRDVLGRLNLVYKGRDREFSLEFIDEAGGD